MTLSLWRRGVRLGLLATVSLVALAAPAHAAPALFPLIAPLLGQIAIWGSSVGLSLTALTGVVTAVSYGLQIGIGIGLSYLSNELLKPNAPKPEERQVLIRESTYPRFRSYGRVKVGGVLVYINTKSGALYRVVATGSGEIDAVEEHWIDDKQVTIDGSGDVTAPDPLTGRINIKSVLGTASQTAYADLISAFPADWTSAHQGNGIPHAMVRLNAIKAQKFAEVYPRGEPNYRQVQRGAKVYDPRDSGHDIDDPSTWEWSDNAALVIADYLTHRDGLRLSRDFIDWDSFAAAADDCDDAIPLKAGGTIPRYRIWTTYGFDERPADVLARMLQACDGQPLTTPAGKIGLSVGKWVTPSVVIDDSAIIDYEMARGRGDIDAANVIKARFTSPLHDYQATEADEWRDEADVTARGAITAQLDFMAVPNHSQVRRLMKLAAARLKPDWSGTLTTNLLGLAVLGERFITLRLSEMEIDQTFEVTADPDFIIGKDGVLMGLKLAVTALASTAFDWDAATEEGTAPAVSDATADTGVENMEGLTATVEQRVVANGASVAVAVIEWDAPTQDSVTPNIEVKLSSGSDATWQALQVAEDQVQCETGVLIDGEDYDVRGRFVSPTGRVGEWTAEETFTAIANTTAPAAVTNCMIVAGVGEVTISFDTPNDLNYIKARIYRSASATFGSASLIATYFTPASTSVDVTVTGQATGTWYYWVVATNGSGIEGTETATTPASVTLV